MKRLLIEDKLFRNLIKNGRVVRIDVIKFSMMAHKVFIFWKD